MYFVLKPSMTLRYERDFFCFEAEYDPKIWTKLQEFFRGVQREISKDPSN